VIAMMREEMENVSQLLQQQQQQQTSKRSTPRPESTKNDAMVQLELSDLKMHLHSIEQRLIQK
jgi:hypothetical protein